MKNILTPKQSPVRSATLVLLCLALVGVSPLLNADDVQKLTVEISGMNYSPAEVKLRKGVPAEITFTRDDKPTCGGTILFPEIGIEKTVEAGESVVVRFTPDKDGELTFTCGMKMMKGRLVVTSK